MVEILFALSGKRGDLTGCISLFYSKSHSRCVEMVSMIILSHWICSDQSNSIDSTSIDSIDSTSIVAEIHDCINWHKNLSHTHL